MVAPGTRVDFPSVGRRYRFGRDGDAYAIWDLRRPGDPVERFPEDRRIQAWLRYRELEERVVDRARRARSGVTRALLVALAALIVVVASWEWGGVRAVVGGIPEILAEVLPGPFPATEVLGALVERDGSDASVPLHIRGAGGIWLPAAEGGTEVTDWSGGSPPGPGPGPGPGPDPSPTEEPSPDPSPTEEPSPDPSPTEEPSPDPSPTEEPSPDPSPTEEPSPTQDPSPTEEPTPPQ